MEKEIPTTGAHDLPRPNFGPRNGDVAASHGRSIGAVPALYRRGRVHSGLKLYESDAFFMSLTKTPFPQALE